MKNSLNQELFLLAKNSKLFQPYWYMKNYNLNFESEEEAFLDYVNKSKFADISPSQNFDNRLYILQNPDVIENGYSPLVHYLLFGKNENRAIFKKRDLPNLETTLEYTSILSREAKKLNVAISLHIYYVDFIEKYSNALGGFPIPFDLYITVNDESAVTEVNEVFSKNQMLKKVECKVVPNKGRNFGPLLVEFSEELKNYDIFAHLHSKKSLYSGREQTEWADYVIEYLLKDKQVVVGMLNLFAKDKKLGMYYPITFWGLPYWANHWLKNYHLAKELFPDFNISNSFFAYPASGMFWARSDAIADILSKNYTYDMFPNEPVDNDGTVLHVIERIVAQYCEKNNFKQFFYYPMYGKFSFEKRFVLGEYLQKNYESLAYDCKQFKSLSFDLFDTIFIRRYFYADYGKKLLGDELVREGAIANAREFVKLRNDTEYNIRIKKNFVGDVDINEIYAEIAMQLYGTKEKGAYLANREFEIDFEMYLPRKKMVQMINDLSQEGKEIYFITDTYYTQEQIQKILKFCGINSSYKLMVSSNNGLRKDNGTVWDMMKKNKIVDLHEHLHVGDNVVSDAQVPGDYGFKNFHIMNPIDKWEFLGYPLENSAEIIFNNQKTIFYGSLISRNGFNPFI